MEDIKEKIKTHLLANLREKFELIVEANNNNDFVDMLAGEGIDLIDQFQGIPIPKDNDEPLEEGELL